MCKGRRAGHPRRRGGNGSYFAGGGICKEGGLGLGGSGGVGGLAFGDALGGIGGKLSMSDRISGGGSLGAGMSFQPGMSME